MSQSTTAQIASWNDYFELRTGGLGRKYQYIDTAVIELPNDLPQPPSDYPVMFSGCHNLVNIEALAKWDTSKMTSTAGMFNHCRSLVDISPLIYWNMSNVTDMSYMFNCCYELIDVSAIALWDVSNVRRMMYIFNGCHELPRFARIEVYDQQTFNCFIERYLTEQTIYVPIQHSHNNIEDMYPYDSTEEEEDVREEWDESTMGPHPFPEIRDSLTMTYANLLSDNEISSDPPGLDELSVTLTPETMRQYFNDVPDDS